jgi:hypothetical protein
LIPRHYHYQTLFASTPKKITQNYARRRCSCFLGVELLLIRLHVDATLKLSAGSPNLEADSAIEDFGMEVLEALNTTVLQRVLDTSSKVRHELGDGSSVRNGTRDTLGDEDTVALREVASSASIALLAVLTATTSLLVLHGVDAAHATVRLDELALSGNERSAGRLGGTGQQTTHHDSGSTEGEALDNVANVLDATIGNAGNTETSRESADGVHAGSLGSADSHDLLGDASAATAHTNTETVNTSSNERSSLLPGDHVSADHIQARELLLDPLDHVNLVHAVTLATVQDNDIETSIDQLLQADLVLRTRANGSSAEELLGVRELRSEGEVKVLVQIGARDHRHEVSLFVDNGKLALLGLGQNLVGLLEVDTSRSGDKVRDHHFGNGLLKVLLKLKIAVGDDTEELGTKLAVLCTDMPVSIQAPNLLRQERMK